MKVIKAKSAGFCFGVKRAVDTVYEQVKENQNLPIYTYGPIIHNEEVVKDLEQKGVIVLRSEEELDTLEKGTVIIRSHGVAKDVYDRLESKKIQIVDATCPFVKKIHNIVQKHSADGREYYYHWKSGTSGGSGNSGLGRRSCRVCFRQRKKQKIILVSRGKRFVSLPRRHLITINLKI